MRLNPKILVQDLVLQFLEAMLTAIWSPRCDWQLDGGIEIFPSLVPDIFLRLGGSEAERTPILVIEIATEEGGGEYDRLMLEYARNNVLYYAIYNPDLLYSGDRDLLEVYRLAGGEYQRQTPHYCSPKTEGYCSIVWMPEIGLGIGCEPGILQSWQRDWLYWYDERGERYPSPEEMLRQRQEEINLQVEQLARLDAQIWALTCHPEQPFRKPMRELYPPLQPYRYGKLKVSDLHEIYWEEAGNPQGKPVIFLHGGPGGGIDPSYRQYFNPQKWRIVLFDQRGCGKSTPHAELRENTTWHLVSDIEQLRELLHIERWVVFGGSWGSTLALAYSQTHPHRCLGLILRGIFLLRPKELHWFYQEGASFIYPDAWEDYLKPIPEAERGDLLKAYYQRLTHEDLTIQTEAAKAWSIWEGSTSKLFPAEDVKHRFGEARFAAAFARIECHYFTNGGFFERENQLIENVDRIRHIPAVIVQGRYDVVCPMTSAWELHRAWPEAELIVVPDAGHSITEPGIRTALMEACERFE